MSTQGKHGEAGATVKRMPPSPVRSRSPDDFHLEATGLWSIHSSTCNGVPAYDAKTLIEWTEAMLRRAWLDGHTHGVFTARKMDEA